MFKKTLSKQMLRSKIEGLMSQKSLRKIQLEDFPFASLGTLSRIAIGNFPKSKRLRDAFNLSHMVSVESCPNCGGVHPIRKCSPKKERREPMLTGSPEDIAAIKWWIEFFKSVEVKNEPR